MSGGHPARLADPTRPFRLDGRVAVVTGASSGIGQALAEGLAAAGARVALAARRQDLLEALAARLRARGADVRAFGCDVASTEDVERLARDVAAQLGPATVLVNNAGFGDPMPAEQEPVDHFVATLEVNLVGVFRCAQAFGRQMLEAGRGSIVNVASILGVVGVGQIPQGSYTASKGAVVNLTRELAAQWARRGVRVNALAPAWFHTEMTDQMFADERARKWIRNRTPMGRPGRVDELVGPLLFLASDASSYVTGHTLLVDGGWTAV